MRNFSTILQKLNRILNFKWKHTFWKSFRLNYVNYSLVKVISKLCYGFGRVSYKKNKSCTEGVKFCSDEGDIFPKLLYSCIFKNNSCIFKNNSCNKKRARSLLVISSTKACRGPFVGVKFGTWLRRGPHLNSRSLSGPTIRRKVV